MPLHIFLVILGGRDIKRQGGRRIIKRSGAKAVFIILTGFFAAVFILLCTPLVSSGIDIALENESDFYTLDISGSPVPSMGHYLIIAVTASNTGSVDYPSGTAAIKWTASSGAADTYQQRFKLYIDGASHNYYIPLGANKGWVPASGFDNMVLELPPVEGTNIGISSVVLRKRIFFPLDIYLGRKLPGTVGTGSVNNFLIPSYILLFLFLVLCLIYYLLFRSFPGKKTNPGKIVKRAVFIFILSILMFFSTLYIYAGVFTIKSYWKAYGDNVMSGELEGTYQGFYDFEKFIMWADTVIPQGKDIIVFVRGEPVYIMSEMAYNLYPRDIKFINISGKILDKINAEIESINEASEDAYKYLIALSEDDAYFASRFELLARYRTTGGFIYEIE